MESAGKLGVIAEGVGIAIMSYFALRVTEGRERVISSQGDVRAKPAIGCVGGIAISLLAIRRCVMPIRGSVRSRRRREAPIPAPEESPATTIWEGGTGA